MQAVGVIGLGIMGSAMAANLLRAGFRVSGFDVLAARRAALRRAGGAPAGSAAAIRAPVVLTSLPGARALHAVAAQLRGPRVVIETSTLALEDKVRARDVLRRKGITLLDCPLSGTGAQAGTKDLVVATMKVEVWQKDMGIIGRFAAGLGAATPLFNASAAIYTAAMAQGHAGEDTASVCAVLERLSGTRRSRHG